MDEPGPHDRYRALPGVAAPDFSTAADEVLAHLQSVVGFKLWMVTRTMEEDWVLLVVHDDHYGLRAGTVLRWAESICFRMVRGNGPNVATALDLEPGYRTAFIRRSLGINAYIGVPMRRDDGTLLGTLCAWDPDVQPDAVHNALPLIELQTRLLTTMLNLELRALEAERKVDQLSVDARHDVDTGLLSATAWLQTLDAEEARCCRYGSPATIAVVRVAAGDNDARMPSRVAKLLTSTCRGSDHVARLDAATFAVLVVEADHTKSSRIQQRLSSAFSAAGIDAFVGVAVRRPGEEGGGLVTAFERAQAYQQGAARAQVMEPRPSDVTSE